MKTTAPTHNAVEKALKILLEFTPNNHALGTMDLSKKLDLHKSTVNRLLHILSRFDFLEQDPRTKKFSLGQSAGEIGRALNQSNETQLITAAGSYIDGLRDRLQETVVLEVLSGNSTILAYVAEGPGPIYVREAVGERRPVHASAGGKLLLAFSAKETMSLYLNRGLPSVTSQTITDIDRLHTHLQKIRRQGYAIDNEEVHVGIRAVGAPVFGKDKKIVAAVVTTGLVQKILIDNNSDLITQVRATAEQISAQLGNKGEKCNGQKKNRL